MVEVEPFVVAVDAGEGKIDADDRNFFGSGE